MAMSLATPPPPPPPHQALPVGGGGGGGGGVLPLVTTIKKYKTVGYAPAPVHPILLVHEMC